jgi:hypothetical protein
VRVGIVERERVERDGPGAMRFAALACAALALVAAPALAQQEQFIGEIRQVAFSFAPKGWLLCRGRRMLGVVGA